MDEWAKGPIRRHLPRLPSPWGNEIGVWGWGLGPAGSRISLPTRHCQACGDAPPSPLSLASPSESCLPVGLSGFPGGSDSNESACNAGDLGLIPGLGKSPGGGRGNPLHYPFLENSTDRGAWRAMVQGIAKSQTRLNN